ncbi:hypothetical protein ACHAXA_010247 [Cyclostephanos tholiformis]|uniref:Uncharacterized protein n=1 Tax=Cyclostephanos tholiformis TaxID=382380 RepID=A0ABD3SG04_9STRA
MRKCRRLGSNISHRIDVALQLKGNMDNDDSTKTSPSFLSTSKANVRFNNRKSIDKNGNSPSNLSSIDQILLSLTSDRTSLVLGSVGILILLLNRLLSFPEDAISEASRSRIDLLGVFAAGSVLLNGITKLDVESVRADRVILEGINQGNVLWSDEDPSMRAQLQKMDVRFQSTVEWALQSFLKCSPAQSAVLLAISPQTNQRWTPLARVGILPSSRSSIFNIASIKTPILDRMLRDDDNIKDGTVGGTEVAGARGTSRKGPNESYLPTLQALPGKVEFTYLPSNAQEALILPVSRPGRESGAVRDDDGWKYAVVLGGDTAKSFAPRDIAWCKEITSWIGELV